MGVRVESQAEPIPGYRLIERLGGGGFGEVWKAEAPGGLHKAIKFVFGEIDSVGGDSQRAEQELKAMRRVQTVRHPFILSLERYDIIDGQLIIVMELADRNLWDRFKECRSQGLPGIPRDELLRYVEEAAEALDLMNDTYQLQHLDIKPQNLFLVHNHVKVADFGLVKDLEGMVASVTGGVTPVYAAPETFDGWVSRFSDQYSLAIVYQELLTGQRPFAGNNVRQLVLQHLQAAPNVAPLPSVDQPIIARALAKSPEERHPTCTAMAQLLAATAALDPIVVSTPDTSILISPSADTRCEESLRRLDSGPLTPGLAVPTPPRSQLGTLTPGPPISAMPTPVPSGVTSQRLTNWIGAPASGPVPATPASEEQRGEGLLFPSLLVGVGGLGLAVLQKTRELLADRCDGASAFPHVRLLYVDTDPEGVRAAGRMPGERSLGGGEIVLARLNRASHYLKPRDGRPDIESWFDAKMLYRIPRTYLTGGCRALGRLALCDNFRAVAQRLWDELTECGDAATVKAAARATKLGLRTTRPRVYVVAGLGGGTGGGMFLDLAYVLRDQLRRLGHDEADVVGLFLLPAAEKSPPSPLPLGNAYTSLTELSHYVQGGGYTAKFVDREPSLQDAGAPFCRTMVLPLPEGFDPSATAEVLTQGAEFLARDLTSPLGRAADRVRAGFLTAGRNAGEGAVCQSFGLYRFRFPRRDLIVRVARRLCQRLVQRWMSKDGAPLHARAQTFVQEQWPRETYGPENFIECLQTDVEKALGSTPQSLFAAVLRELAGHATLDPVAVNDALAQLEKLVGRPAEGTLADLPCRLEELLRESGDRTVAAWGHRLAELVVQLIESPEDRLAGAEEAVRHIVALLQQLLEHQEPLVRDLTSRAADAYERINKVLEVLQKPAPPKGRVLPPTVDVLELMRSYPKWRYQALVLQQVSRGLVSLRGLMSDELREVNFCRARLGDLVKRFEETPDPLEATATVPGRNLWPGRCETLAEAVEGTLSGVTAEQTVELDGRVQAMIRRQFTALVHVCLTPTNMLPNLEHAMQQEAEALVRSSLSWSDAAELFLEQHADEDAAREALSAAFDEAEGEYAGKAVGRGAELAVLVTPDGKAGERLRALALEALPDRRLITATGGDDILFYREATRVGLAQLPQLGPAGQEAYRQLRAVDHFTPHTRTDVTFTAS